MPILNGWKSIMNFCGINDRETILKWVEEFKLPVVIIGGRATACTESIVLWHREIQKNSPGRKPTTFPHKTRIKPT